MSTLRSFHNDPKLKELILAQITAHEIADEIIHGKYWEDGKGCAVGCTIHSSDHMAYETKLGLPVFVARMEDYLFESMSNGHAKTFPRAVIESIAVGSNLSTGMPKVLLELQKRNLKLNPANKDFIQPVINLLSVWFETGEINERAADSAADSADSAADSAAYSAAGSAVVSAAGWAEWAVGSVACAGAG